VICRIKQRKYVICKYLQEAIDICSFPRAIFNRFGVYVKMTMGSKPKKQNGLCALSSGALFGWGRPPAVKRAVRCANVEGFWIKSSAGPFGHLCMSRV
jgi:hypothetical protein